MNLLRIKFLRQHKIIKIIIICNHANKIFIILQIKLSIFKFQDYRIQFLVMRILLFYYFFEFVIYKCNEILLIIIIFLIKHAFDVAIKRIDFHLQRNISIIIL